MTDDELTAILADLPDDLFRNRLRRDLEGTTMTDVTIEPANRFSRVGGIGYLHIPATDGRRSAAFYQAVFGWNIRGNPEAPGFDDATGHVAGGFTTDTPPSAHPGLLPHIFVEDIDNTINRIVEEGGEVAREPFPEGELWVAHFRDPAGNVLGIWQGGPRRSS